MPTSLEDLSANGNDNDALSLNMSPPTLPSISSRNPLVNPLFDEVDGDGDGDGSYPRSIQGDTHFIPIGTTIGTFQNADASTGFAQSQVDAALGAASFGSSTAAAAEDKPKSKRKTYSYKDRGIRAGKSFFILPDKQESAVMCPEFMEGVITSLPKKSADVNYTIHWTSTENLPINFDQSYLRRTLCKDDKSGMIMLKAARDGWDAEHPNQKNPRVSPKNNTKRRSKSRATTVRSPPNSARRTMEILTSLRMSPSLDPIEEEDHREPQTNNTVLYAENSDSDSDDGSDMEVGDTYIPVAPGDDGEVLPDEGYDPQSMEMDGDYVDLSNIEFNYEELEGELEPPHNMYKGSGPSLRRGIAKSFKTSLECAQKCGGISYNFMKRLTANSNEYANQNRDPLKRTFAGYAWHDITVEEMYRFHGVVLKMSIDDRNLGGYEAYFDDVIQINLSQDYNVKVSDFPPWAKKVFSLRRFKQIRAAYHPEVGSSAIGDKCHQLRFAINQLNHASRATFIPGPNLSFDEGGVASRSRMNPVRQYNKDKPNKFRVDFFVLANNTPEKYFIVDLDVYQGKNAANIGIAKEIEKLPTTQKAVVNAVINSKIANDPKGMRRIFMDNRYTAALLLIMLREKYGLLGAGTTRRNRIGWAKDDMDLKKSDERGTNKVLYDKVNKVLIIEWVDNRVVRLTSTLEVSGEVDVKRRSGSNILDLKVEKALREYQEYMDGVDRGDQYREMGSGFATKAHYKKWYKKAYFAILDFMILNAFFAWNMSAEEEPSLNRWKVKKWQFNAALAEEMIAYVDTEQSEDANRREAGTSTDDIPTDGHTPMPAVPAERNRCMVCKLEEKWRKEDGLKDAYGMNCRSQKHMVVCACCQLAAHGVPMGHDRKIFDIPELEGMSCFSIAHSEFCKGLWSVSSKIGEVVPRNVRGASQGIVPVSTEMMTRSYETKRKHHVYQSLLRKYGRDKETRPRQKRNTDTLEEEEGGPPAIKPKTDSTNGGGEGESC